MKIEKIFWKKEDVFFHQSDMFSFPNNLSNCRSIDGDTTSRLTYIYTQVRCHSVMIFCLHVFFIIRERLNYIVKYRPIAR
jgi:hypothetical protein